MGNGEFRRLSSADWADRYRAVHHYFEHGLGDDREALVIAASEVMEEGRASSLLSVIFSHPHADFVDPVRALIGRFPALRIKAVLVAEKLGDVETLTSLLHREESPVTLAAMCALARMRAPEVVDFLKQHAAGSQGYMASKSLQLLAEMGRPEGLTIAVERGRGITGDLVYGSSPGLGRMIVWALNCAYAREDVSEAVSGLPEEEVARLHRVQRSAAEIGMARLALITANAGFDGLVLEMKRTDLPRLAVYRAMLKTDPARAREFVEAQLNKPGEAAWAIGIVVKFDHRDLFPRVEAHLSRSLYSEGGEPEWALATLVWMKGKDAVEHVRKALGHPLRGVRERAIKLVAELDDRQSEKALLGLLHSGLEQDVARRRTKRGEMSSERWVAVEAAKVLVGWGCQAAFEPILERVRATYDSTFAQFLSQLDQERALEFWANEPDQPDLPADEQPSAELLRLQHPPAVKAAIRELVEEPDAWKAESRAYYLLHKGVRTPPLEARWEWLGQIHSLQKCAGVDGETRQEMLWFLFKCIARLGVRELIPLLLEWVVDRGDQPDPCWWSYTWEDDPRAEAIKALVVLDPARAEECKSMWLYGYLAGAEPVPILHGNYMRKPWLG